MASTKYLVEIMHDPTPERYSEKLYNAAYVSIYNEFAEWTNPQYEVWNAEYEASGLPMDGGELHSQYDAFIAKKYAPKLRELEKKFEWIVKRLYLGEELDLRIEWFDGTNTQMYLVPQEVQL